MSFETISLLLNWVQLGVLLAILFRLHHTFDLIANTQRELRRAIRHLGDHRAAEPGIDTTPMGHRSSRSPAPRDGARVNLGSFCDVNPYEAGHRTALAQRV